MHQGDQQIEVHEARLSGQHGRLGFARDHLRILVRRVQTRQHEFVQVLRVVVHQLVHVEPVRRALSLAGNVGLCAAHLCLAEHSAEGVDHRARRGLHASIRVAPQRHATQHLCRRGHVEEDVRHDILVRDVPGALVEHAHRDFLAPEDRRKGRLLLRRPLLGKNDTSQRMRTDGYDPCRAQRHAGNQVEHIYKMIGRLGSCWGWVAHFFSNSADEHVANIRTIHDEYAADLDRKMREFEEVSKLILRDNADHTLTATVKQLRLQNLGLQALRLEADIKKLRLLVMRADKYRHLIDDLKSHDKMRAMSRDFKAYWHKQGSVATATIGEAEDSRDMTDDIEDNTKELHALLGDDAFEDERVTAMDMVQRILGHAPPPSGGIKLPVATAPVLAAKKREDETEEDEDEGHLVMERLQKKRLVTA